MSREVRRTPLDGAEAGDPSTEPERTFGAAVQRARAERCWSQEQVRRRLAASFGVDLSSSAFSRLECAKRPIRFGEAVALAALLNIDLAPLIPAGVPIAVCDHCDGTPPAGFTCNDCGTAGEGA